MSITTYFTLASGDACTLGVQTEKCQGALRDRSDSSREDGRESFGGTATDPLQGRHLHGVGLVAQQMSQTEAHPVHIVTACVGPWVAG